MVAETTHARRRLIQQPEPEVFEFPVPRRLPHSIEAEMALIGAIIVNNKAHAVSDYLKPEHFALAEHRTIYKACRLILDKGDLLDSVILKNSVSDVSLSNIGGVAYINKLVDAAVTVLNAREYARYIHELYVRRCLIDAASGIIDSAYNEEEDVRLDARAQIDSAVRRISDIEHHRESNIDFERFHVRYLDAKPREENRELLGTWLHPRSIVMISGPEKSGKTFLLSQIARAVATGEGLFAWEGKRSARVLYLDYEVGFDLMRKRREAMYKRHGSAGDLYVMSYDDWPLPRLDTYDGMSWLEALLDAMRPGVCIIDNLGKITSETVSDDKTAKSVSDLYRLIHGHDCGVIMGHHTGYDETRAAGSRVFQNDLTASALLQRDWDAPPPLTSDFMWKTVRSGSEGEGEFRRMRLRLNVDCLCLDEIVGAVSHRVEDRVRWAYELLCDLIRRYGRTIDAPAPDVSYVTVDEWKASYTSSMPGTTVKDAEKELQTMVRTGLAMCKTNKIWTKRRS